MRKDKHYPIGLMPIQKSPDIPNLVAKQIIDSIASGALKPGDKLPSEHDMTERFGISRISLREAMKLLEAKGYIESHGRRGKFILANAGPALESTIEGIISINHEKIWELLSVRRIIDSEAARMAALTATRSQIARLRRFKTDAEKIGIANLVATREGGKLYARIYNDLADSTNNTIFAHLMKSISSLLKGALPYSRQKLVSVPEAPESFYSQHVRIILAIEEGDADEAKRAVIDHIDWLEKTLKKVLT
ncbi:MAG: FadR family transcriptional regulator [Chrysiogenales bacterium]|nr:MAG: FadR family transcriptional regulator [Chrysiogenales bacterium]